MKNLIELLNSVPKAAALINQNHCILDCNSAFIAQIGEAKGQKIGNWLADDPHLDKINKLLPEQKPGWHGAEIMLNLPGGAALCWCETHSLITDKQLVHFLEIVNVEMFRKLEAAYLHQLRRVVDDNLWILDEDGRLIWVRADNQNFKNFLGRDSRALIFKADQQSWDTVLIEAKTSPGQTKEVQLRAAADASARFIDVCYLAGTLMGGRFYAASRSTSPSGSRIILRLKEAWAVSNDEDLARHLGTKKSAIHRANAAESVPPVWLVKTGQMTGFSLDWLLTGQGDKRRM